MLKPWKSRSPSKNIAIRRVKSNFRGFRVISRLLACFWHIFERIRWFNEVFTNLFLQPSVSSPVSSPADCHLAQVDSLIEPQSTYYRNFPQKWKNIKKIAFKPLLGVGSVIFELPDPISFRTNRSKLISDDFLTFFEISLKKLHLRALGDPGGPWGTPLGDPRGHWGTLGDPGGPWGSLGDPEATHQATV